MDEIISASDGVMVARGDLSSYADYGLLSVYQKKILNECKIHNKFSIVSTGVFMSIFNKALPRPAEIIDIANCVYDGADAIQFCEETAHYNDPAYVIRIAQHVIDETFEYIKSDR